MHLQMNARSAGHPRPRLLDRACRRRDVCAEDETFSRNSCKSWGYAAGSEDHESRLKAAGEKLVAAIKDPKLRGTVCMSAKTEHERIQDEKRASLLHPAVPWIGETRNPRTLSNNSSSAPPSYTCSAIPRNCRRRVGSTRNLALRGCSCDGLIGSAQSPALHLRDAAVASRFSN